MTDNPAIPYGYKVVTGQLQKGDGIWDHVNRKWRKAKKVFPYVGEYCVIAIRKCEVTQPALIGVDVASGPDEHVIVLTDGNGRNPTRLNREQYEALKKSGMLWEFHPDAPADWPLPGVPPVESMEVE